MKHLPGAVALMLLFLAGFITGGIVCNRMQPNPVSDTTYITHIVPGDSVPVHILTKVPVVTALDTIPTRIPTGLQDTFLIVSDYLATRYYQDTLVQPGNFLAVIRDSVAENRITYRSVDHQNLRQQEIHTTRITSGEAGTKRFSLGGGILAGSQGWFAGPILQMTDHKHNTFTIQAYTGGNAPLLIGVAYTFRLPAKPFIR